jgi:hypothetical protein
MQQCQVVLLSFINKRQDLENFFKIRIHINFFYFCYATINFKLFYNFIVFWFFYLPISFQ